MDNIPSSPSPRRQIKGVLWLPAGITLVSLGVIGFFWVFGLWRCGGGTSGAFCFLAIGGIIQQMMPVYFLGLILSCFWWKRLPGWYQVVALMPGALLLLINIFDIL